MLLSLPLPLTLAGEAGFSLFHSKLPYQKAKKKNQQTKIKYLFTSTLNTSHYFVFSFFFLKRIITDILYTSFLSN